MSKTYPNIPQHEMDALSRCLLPAIQEYFESKEGQQAFAEWKAQQRQKRGNRK